MYMYVVFYFYQSEMLCTVHELEHVPCARLAYAAMPVMLTVSLYTCTLG